MNLLRILLATIVGAAVLFGWGFLFWGVLPLGKYSMEEEPFGSEAMVKKIAETLPTSGVYFIPHPVDPAETEEQKERYQTRHRQGPLVRVFFNKRGAEPMAPRIFALGAAHYAGISLLCAVLLSMAAPAIPNYTRRVFFVFLLGAVAAVWLGLNEAIWFYHPLKYELYQLGYVLAGGLVLGVVHAATIKPPAGEQTA